MQALTGIIANIINSILAVIQAILALGQNVVGSALKLVRASVLFIMNLFQGAAGFIAGMTCCYNFTPETLFMLVVLSQFLRPSRPGTSILVVHFHQEWSTSQAASEEEDMKFHSGCQQTLVSSRDIFRPATSLMLTKESD